MPAPHGDRIPRPNPPAKGPPVVAIVEPFSEGHHPMYVAGYWQAFRAIGCHTVFVGPQGLAADAELAFAQGRCVIPPEAIVPWDPVGAGGLRGLSAADAAGVLWRGLRATLANRRIDLVFLMSLDSFVTEKTPRGVVDDAPWHFSGLWFRPPSAAPRSTRDAVRRMLRYGRRFPVLRSKRCGPVLVLNHAAAISHLAGLTPCGVVTAPEFSTYDRSNPPTAGTVRIREWIGGRRAVVLVGSLEPRKGVREFIRLAEVADPRQWAFVMAGRLYRQVFDHETLSALHRATAGESPRILLHDGWLEAGEINDVVACADLLFVCYDRWEYSSNMLCKAAFFGVPVLAYPRGYAGHVVDEYGLGILVRDGRGLVDTVRRPSFPGELAALRRDPRFRAGCARYLIDNDIASLEKPLAAVMREPSFTTGGEATT